MKKDKNWLFAMMLSIIMAAATLGVIPSQAFGAGEQADAEGSQIDPASAAAASASMFQLNVRIPTDGSTFLLPTSGGLIRVTYGKAFNWVVEWGDGSTLVAAGVSSEGGGIPHSYRSAGEYTITIRPNGSTEAWLAAFGFYAGLSGSNSPVNKAMMTSVTGPITPDMTRSAAQVSGISAAPTYEWYCAFYDCANLRQAPLFVGWEGIASVGDGFAQNMFCGCASLASLPAGFNLPGGIIRVGQAFASGMFTRCTSLASLPAGFNFPQGITDAGSMFASSMFYSCTSLGRLPDGFRFPQGIRTADDYFAAQMFFNCTSLYQLPAGFNMPQSLTVARSYFAREMFDNCVNLGRMPDGFNLPQNLSTTGDSFAASMFRSCSSLDRLSTGFNFPQKLTSVGADFASYMFAYCTSLGNLPAGLNLPQNITKAGNNFAYGLFFMAGGPNFQVNLEFVLPALLARNYVGAFCFYSFYLSSLVPVQNRMAASIIGNCPTPSGGNPTFDSHFRDIEYLPVQWGGGGLAYENTGAPRSGDLNGDGMVTIDEVLIATQAAVDNMELTPAQMAALDIDGDGRITMADIVAMTKLLYKIL